MRRTLLSAVVLMAWCAAFPAQQGQTGPPPTSPSLSQRPASGQDPNAKAPLNPKKAQLKADSEKLSKAAAELRTMLARTNEDTMSLEVIKKAEEVQRLAKQVQKDLKEQ